MKGTDYAILAAVAIGGFALYKGNFFKGVGDVAEGVGDAAGGVGSGIGFIGETGGQAIGNTLTSAGGLLANTGNQASNIITELGTGLSETTHSLRDDVNSFVDYAGNPFVDVAQSASNLTSFLPALTQNVSDKLNPDKSGNIFNWVSSGVSSVFDWTKSQTSSAAKSLRSSITGNAISSTSPTSNVSSSGGSSRAAVAPIITYQTPNTFLEKLGYQGQSTLNGIVYSRPSTSLRSIFGLK